MITRRIAQALGSLALTVLLGACASSRPSLLPASGSGEVVQLNIITAPVGLNIDGIPGVDGFSAKVYANNARDPKPVPIRTGTLEIVMFDGVLFGKTNIPPPLRVWSFTSDQLKQLQFTAGIGTGYDFLLQWGSAARPTQRIITVGARYTSPEGRVLTSSLSSVTVIDQPR